jgi:acyl-CoA synthetase (AMP-forming)/AMP-acid ligase II
MEPITYANLPALADEAATRFAAAPLWVSIDDGSRLSFADFRRLTLKCAHALRAIGVAHGAHVAVLLPNAPAYAITWFALARLGAVMIPVNSRNTSRELAYVLRDCDANFLVIDSEYLPVYEGMENRDRFVGRANVIVHGGGGNAGSRVWDAIVSAAPESAIDLDGVRPDTRMSIQYTSGSSGMPKGCVLTQDYWIVLGTVRAQQGPPAKRILIDKPMSYMGGMWRFLMCLCLGASAYVARQFTLTGLQQRLIDHRIDFFSATDAVAKLPEHPDIKSLDIAWISISGLSKGLHRALEEKFHAPVRELYGLTETGSTIYMPADAGLMSGSGSCGLPAPFRECRIVDEHGIDVKRGEVGELWVRGRGILIGYHNNPEADRAAFAGDWFRTGDLFQQDADGFYYIRGRIKDSIRRSGENIAAREVEAVAAGTPGVLECAAVAVPDVLRGQEVKLCVVLQPGNTPATVPPQRIIGHCAGQLAAFKVPRYIEYYEDFPRTSSGKIAKQQLAVAGHALYDHCARERT